MYELLTVQVEENICIIALNRPTVLNALNVPIRKELADALSEAEADSQVRVVILTGTGRAFCVGADLAAAAERPVETETMEFWQGSSQQAVCEGLQIWSFKKPIIAAVNGFALGMGCDLALMCDLVIASETASFGMPEIRGRSGEMTLIVPWLVNAHLAKEFLLLGERIPATEAHRIGLINRVCPLERLLSDARQMAATLARIDPFTLAMNKASINRTYEMMGLRTSLNAHAEVIAQLHASDPPHERADRKRLIRERGLKAALEQRDGPR